VYAPFIVDDPQEPGENEHEWIVVLDDWIDGVGNSPEQILADLQAAGCSSDGGDVTYPLYLVNGRTEADPFGVVVAWGPPRGQRHERRRKS
jgi:multicopper oxidase